MRRLQLVCLFVRSCKFSTVIPLQDGKAMGVDHAPTLRVGPRSAAISGTVYTRLYRSTQSDQILHSDLARDRKIYMGCTTPPQVHHAPIPHDRAPAPPPIFSGSQRKSTPFNLERPNLEWLHIQDRTRFQGRSRPNIRGWGSKIPIFQGIQSIKSCILVKLL